MRKSALQSVAVFTSKGNVGLLWANVAEDSLRDPFEFAKYREIGVQALLGFVSKLKRT